jgi:hypothetical protein
MGAVVAGRRGLARLAPSVSSLAYTARQTALVLEAIQRARQAMDRARRYDAEVFARTFIQHEGVQIPGRGHDPERAREVGTRTLAALAAGEAAADDPDARREVHRARVEARWARAAQDEGVVGFRVELGPEAATDPLCRTILNEDNGLGAGVFPKTRILVMPPCCTDYDYRAVREHEVEQ